MTANRFIIAGVVLILASLPALVTGLRKERVHLRGPYGRMDLRRQPVKFWSSIAVTGLAAISGLAMLTWGLLQKL
jgi:hypothetical protein